MTQMTAQVFFVVGQAKDVLRGAGGRAASAAGAARRSRGADRRAASFERRDVELGLVNRVAAEVRSGLEPGERVATAAAAPARSARSASAAASPKMGPRL